MAQHKPQFWQRKTFCVITGASQGIGRQIAIDFAKKVSAGSTFLLLARNVDKLNETKALMQKANGEVNVFVKYFDFNEPISGELHKLIGLPLMAYKQDADDFELALIVHNAGSLGDLTENTFEMNNLEKIIPYFTLNVFSVMILNSEFLKYFDVDKRQGDLDRPHIKAQQKAEIGIVNITSLCAIKPFASMGYYCMGKSSRETYFGVLSQENKNYTVLNYSPGPVLTEMTDDIIQNIQNEEMRDMFIKMKGDSTILTTEQTVDKLVQVLEKRSFVSGGRIDYYDP